MVFCRTKLFTTKFPICGSTLLLTQFKRKDDAAEYCADLAQETLGGEVWCTRLEATVADGEKTLADQRFMSCVLIHGMGGTGKTVTAVAVLQEQSIREWFRSVFWLTVGADAINTQLHQLQVSFHKQVSDPPPTDW